VGVQNAHLQYAIAKYGIGAFIFKVVALCAKEHLIEREQIYLDLLFKLPSSLRYNFLSTAGSMLGFKHSEQTRAKIREKMSGSNHHNYGLVAYAVGVSVFTLDNVLVKCFDSRTSAAE